MKNKMMLAAFSLKNKVERFLKDENGEANLIAIILVIVVVIALVAIFRNSLTQLVQDLLKKISDQAMGI